MIDVGVPVNQGSPPHGAEQLGSGARTIGAAGCLLSCLTMVARSLTGHRGLTVLEAHERIKRAGGFVGSGLKRGTAARALGLRLVDADGSERFDIDGVRAELAQGRPVIAGIDYRPGRSSGLSDADHFVVIIDEDDDGSLIFADPAQGAFVAVRTPLSFSYGRSKMARFAEVCRLIAAPV